MPRDGVPDMASAYYKRLTWWFTRLEIGRKLRERYEVPDELPPKLLALVNRLDLIEGNYLLRYVRPAELPSRTLAKRQAEASSLEMVE